MQRRWGKKGKNSEFLKQPLFLFHNLKGQSVKVDRSKREEEREQEDRRWRGGGVYDR